MISREELVELLVCPYSELADRVNRGCVKMRIPTREEYLAATGAEREHVRRFMAGDYAYSLGYRDQQGEIRQVHFSGGRFVPCSPTPRALRSPAIKVPITAAAARTCSSRT